MILNGRRLRRVRERARKTLMDVAIEARSCGLPKCSPALISQWETGLHDPTHPEYVIGILAKILEVDPVELTKGDEA